MMNKTKYYFFRILTITILPILGICWIANFVVAQDNSLLKALLPTTGSICFLLLGVFLFSILLWKVLRVIETMSTKVLWRMVVLMLVFSGLIYIVLVSTLHIIPKNDSHTMLDQALLFAKSGQRPITSDSVYYNYYSKYSNNYVLTILFSYFYRLLLLLGIGNFYTAAYALNAFCLFLGNILTFCIAKRCKGLLCGTKVLVFCTLNPVFYLMAFWVYSNTISVPFMTGIFYLGICIYQAKKLYQRMALSILTAFLAVLAYQIRPTAIFPFIALMIGAIFFALRRLRQNGLDLRWCGKWCLLVTLSLGVMAATHMQLSLVSEEYFGNVMPGNYPLTHWLMMGSHNYGTYDHDDDLFTNKLDNEAKLPMTAKKTVENYHKLGLYTPIFWITKMIILWSDGSFAAGRRLSQSVGNSPLTDFVIGNGNHLLMLYCQIFWLTTVLFTMINLTKQLRRKKVMTYDFMFLITLFGGFALYVIWEVKAEYAIPFLPLFFLVAGSLQFPSLSAPLRISKKHQKWIVKGSLLGFLIYSVFLQVSYLGQNASYIYSIHCCGRSWMRDISVENYTQLSQTFFPEADFDTISLCAKLSSDSNATNNDGALRITLYNGRGTQIFKQTIHAADLDKNQNLVLNVGKQPSDATRGYKLVINTEDGRNGQLILRTTKGMLLDSYPGDLTIDGVTQDLDIYMSVYQLKRI